MTDSQQLLAAFVTDGSETAFRELVSRYMDLVYSAANRLVGGDGHLAEDVAQMVFTEFARKAHTLSKDAMIGGWLHRHTCYVARTVMRGERRRQIRERRAVEMNAFEQGEAGLGAAGPELDEAINQLGAEDRSAILLRFFEKRDFRSIGAALGSNEDAAQKRVARALEKLHGFLRRKGVSLSIAGLGTAMMAGAVTAAPAGLAVTVSTSALATAATGGAVLTLIKVMTTTKAKIALASLAAAAAVATPATIQYQSAQKLKTENTELRQKADQFAALQAENERLSNLAESAKNAAALTAEEKNELLKLRSEVGALRKQKDELDRVRAEISQLRSQPIQARTAGNFNDRIVATIGSPQSPEDMRNACVNILRQIDGAKQMWALEHKVTGDTIPSQADIQPYLGRGPNGTFPTCPAGGVYTILSPRQMPTCSVPGHELK